MTKQAAWLTRQSTWAYLSSALTDAGRRDILRRYRQLRRQGVARGTVRACCKDLAHGVWMAKRGGW